MKQLIITMLCLLSIACQSGGTKASSRPAWIDDPKDGAVGSCVTHVSGRHAQEELAIARARTRLAARLGVTVDQIQNISEKVVNDQAFVSSTTETQQTIKNQTVRAQVRQMWHDKVKDELWVWVYPIK